MIQACDSTAAFMHVRFWSPYKQNKINCKFYSFIKNQFVLLCGNKRKTFFKTSQPHAPLRASRFLSLVRSPAANMRANNKYPQTQVSKIKKNLNTALIFRQQMILPARGGDGGGGHLAVLINWVSDSKTKCPSAMLRRESRTGAAFKLFNSHRSAAGNSWLSSRF